MKIINLSRSVAVTSASSNNTDVTIITSANHNLVTGDTISFNQTDNKRYVVTVSNATTFTVPVDTTQGMGNVVYPVGFIYPTALTASALVSVTYANGTNSDSTITFQGVGKTSAGTGAASVNIEVSNDGANWLNFGTIALTLGTAATSVGLVISAPWGYIRANASSITGTNAKVNVLMGRNS